MPVRLITGGNFLALVFTTLAVLTTTACFTIILEERQPRTQSTTRVPPQDIPTGTPTPHSEQGISSPTPTATSTSQPMGYSLTVNGIPVESPIVALAKGVVELSSEPENSGGLYSSGQEVSLTAVAKEGHRFSGWAGDCSGASDQCLLTIDGDKRVDATFEEAERLFALAVESEPQRGQVVVSPTPQADGSKFAMGAEVTIKAINADGLIFSSWSGACTGVSDECRLVMDSDKSVKAHFATKVYSLSINEVLVQGRLVELENGSVALTASLLTLDEGFPPGTQVTLTAAPNEGYIVGSWGGDCADAQAETDGCTLKMNEDKVVTVEFVAEPTPEP